MSELLSRNNSTLPPTTATWRPDPNVRGTWGLVWTCLSTLLICVWNVVHVDVPIRPGRGAFFEKLRWLVVGLLAPDYLLYVAFCQLYRAQEISAAEAKYLKTKKRTSGRRAVTPDRAPKWSDLSTAFLTRYLSKRRELPQPDEELQMVRDSAGEDIQRLGLSPPIPLSESNTGLSSGEGPVVRKHEWTLTHSFYAAMGGFVLDVDSSILPPRCPSDSCHPLVLRPDGVRYLMEHAPTLLPDISEASILHRCQSDSIGKAVLIAQLSYFCLSCTVRAAQGLTVSLLEITTLAHALCAVAAYAVWWRKPKNIAEPTAMSGAGVDDVAAFLIEQNTWVRSRWVGLRNDRPNDADVAGYLQMPSEGSHRRLLARAWAESHESNRNPQAHTYLSSDSLLSYSVVLDYTEAVDESDRRQGIAGVVPLIYGAIHLIAWNAAFPTAIERLLWRITALVATILAMCICLSQAPADTDRPLDRLPFLRLMPQRIYLDRPVWEAGMELLRLAAAVPYPIMAMYTMIESVRQVFYLPADAFTLPDFSVYFPHF